jgi:PAS domain S-box-containing protein
MRLVLITSGVVLFLTCAAFFAYELFTFRETTREQLSTLGKIVAANSTASVAFLDTDDAIETLHALQAEKHIEAACLYDTTGRLFAKYPTSLDEKSLPAQVGVAGYQYINNHLEGFEPVIQEGKQVGTLYLRSNLEAIYERFKLYSIIVLCVLAVSFVIAYLLSRRLQKRISGPILALANTAGNISKENDYSVRATKYDDDEVGILTEAFNQMLSQIERQNDEITSFNSALERKVNERTAELEQANAELKLKNEFVETIIDSSVDVIAVFDKNLNYVILNKYGNKVYNIENDGLIGRNLVDVFPQVKGSQMHLDLQQAFSGEIVHNAAYRSRVSDRVFENFYIPLRDKDDKVYRVLVIGHDITELANANEKLKLLNADLEKSNRDLEQFAYVASHDLQEPLRKIQTFSNLLSQNLANKESADRYLEKIISSAARMTDLIKAVLNYSRLSDTNASFEMVPLNEILTTIQTDYELAIAEREAVIKAGSLPVIYGNRLQLNQLFLNLISNALKFSKEKPEISITANTVDKDAVPGNEALNGASKYVEIIFKDNGIGFEQQFADRIFTVFQRLHNRQEYPGTGIGLALCKKIVDNHHGHITVTSDPGVGTSFYIYLPATLPVNSESSV